MFIDLHCDTISLLQKNPARGNLRQNDANIDLDKLAEGEVAAQFFALYIDKAKSPSPLEAALCMLDTFYQELAANEEKIAFAGCAADFARNQAAGKISAFLTVEEGGVLQGRIEQLRNLYRLGVRLVTLTWNYPNEIGFPNFDAPYRSCGLTEFGREVVCEMNRLGMLVDVSHLSDAGFDDVAALSAKPFVASHSNCRAVTAHPRNMTDAMIRRLAEKGGVMGVNFSRNFLGDSPVSRVEDMMRHVRHAYKVGGVEVLALGTDFDGIAPSLEIEHAGQLGKFTAALAQNGFTETEIEKICWRNALRVMQDCL